MNMNETSLKAAQNLVKVAISTAHSVNGTTMDAVRVFNILTERTLYYRQDIPHRAEASVNEEGKIQLKFIKVRVERTQLDTFFKTDIINPKTLLDAIKMRVCANIPHFRSSFKAMDGKLKKYGKYPDPIIVSRILEQGITPTIDTTI